MKNDYSWRKINFKEVFFCKRIYMIISSIGGFGIVMQSFFVNKIFFNKSYINLF